MPNFVTGLVTKLDVQMGRIERPPRTFQMDNDILFNIYYNEYTKENQKSWDKHCKKYKPKWPCLRYSEI